ncbi:MAG: hypothetical protein ABL889_16985 [Terricaulis sp.]
MNSTTGHADLFLFRIARSPPHRRDLFAALWRQVRRPLLPAAASHGFHDAGDFGFGYHRTISFTYPIASLSVLNKSLPHAPTLSLGSSLNPARTCQYLLSALGEIIMIRYGPSAI